MMRLKQNIHFSFATLIPVFLLILTLSFGLLADVKVHAAAASLLEDDADLLTDEEEDKVVKKLTRVSDQRDCDIAVITTGNLNGMEAVDYVDNIIDTQGYGSGREHGTVTLLIFIDETDETNREVRIATDETANAFFSDDDNNKVIDSIIGDLGDGEYADACMTYADTCDDIFADSLGGSRGLSPAWLLGDLGIGAAIAMLLGTFQKSKLKTKKRKSGAADYKADGGIDFSVKKDTFLNKRVERRKIEKDDSNRESSHEAGTTHTTSSGSKHGGAGRKF